MKAPRNRFYGQPVIQWRGCGRFLLSVLISAPLWGVGSHTASLVVEHGWDPAFVAWICSVTSVLAAILCRVIKWGRGEPKNGISIRTESRKSSLPHIWSFSRSLSQCGSSSSYGSPVGSSIYWEVDGDLGYWHWDSVGDNTRKLAGVFCFRA
ncbi:uncharacterized protein [Ranitomeya imitator]|uniref:uncharacterized protein isoform X3 n=1 Tax=Ranitomeya imitator TaxID=111125 RepID=UPI0037E84EFD